MNRNTSSGPHHRVVLRQKELYLLLSALAQALEEPKVPYDGHDTRKIARLHSRLRAIVRGEPSPDYTVRDDGAVVATANRKTVIAPPQGLAALLLQAGAQADTLRQVAA